MRCFGNLEQKTLLAKYHDEEWCVPSYEDNYLFEMLILEGAHAGLNWELILKKRPGYRKAFKDFNPKIVAVMTDLELDGLLSCQSIIRNRLKVYSARRNAKVFIEIQQEFGTFAKYLWEFVGGVPVQGNWTTFADIPSTTSLSDVLSKDLKKRGMSFVGSTIIYSYMQAVGMVNDHIIGCIMR